MDQAALISTVESRLNRTDLTSLIPDFIKRAEDTIRARLAANPVRPMGAAATATLSAGETALAIPTDLVDVIDLVAADSSESWQLVRLDPSDPSAFYSSRALPFAVQYDSAKPRQYSVLGDTINMAAAYASDLTMTLSYYQRLPDLATKENWLAARHGNVYEFGALAHAYKHLRDDDAATLNMNLFLSAIDEVIESYPERANPAERRSDIPLNSTWSILNG